MLTDIIFVSYTHNLVKLHIGPTEEVALDVFCRIAMALGNPVIKLGDKKYRCNILFKNTKEGREKLATVCKEFNQKELWWFYNAISSVDEGSFFILALCDSDWIPNTEERLNAMFYLMSKDTGTPISSLRESFDNYSKDIIKFYDTISNFDSSERTKPIGHSNQSEYRCRICGKAKSDNALFSSKAHAISQVVGNKSIVLLDECDECNGGIVSKLENSIAAYFYAIRLFLGIKGQHSRIHHVEDGLEISNPTGNGVEIKYTDENKCHFHQGKNGNLEVELMINCGKYVPQHIYRLLSKFAISVISEKDFDYEEFAKLRQWIKDGVQAQALPFVAINIDGGKNPNFPHITVYRRKEDAPQSLPKYLCDFFALAHRFLFELPFVENEVKMTNEKAWQKLFALMPILGKDKQWEYSSFDCDSMMPYFNRIVCTAMKRIPPETSSAATDNNSSVQRGSKGEKIIRLMNSL